MQMKYLSLALAAALATTLTACGGSDNKSNYNKDTLTPVTNPDAGNTGGTTDGGNTNTDGGNTNTNTDGGNTNTDGTNDQTEEGGDNNSDSDNDNESGTGTELPGPDPVNNPGQAAYKGEATTKSSSVGQQYRRGYQSTFDKELNLSDSGNATVFSWRRLENQKMTNIVNGRETRDIKDSDNSLRRFTGQNTVYQREDEGDQYSLQTVNGNNNWAILAGFDGGAKTVDELYANSKSYNPQDKLTGMGSPLLGEGHEFFDKGDLAASDKEPYARASMNDITGDFADTENNLKRNKANNGLVKIDNVRGQGFVVTGQEDQVTRDVDKDNTVDVIDIFGQNSPTRVFGKLYNKTETKATTAANEANSWVFAKDQAFAVDSSSTGAATVTDPRYKRVSAVTASDSQIGKHSEIAVNGFDKLGKTSLADSKGSFGLAAKAIKLNHVQYGRVTSNINALDKKAVEAAIAQSPTKQAFFYAPYRNKFNYNIGEDLTTTPNNTVDTYYYRGVGFETSLDEMSKLPQNGQFIYNGHATSYGLDNKFHGSQATGGTNSFAFGADQVGLGNFVSARYDVAKKSVEGSIYNAWLPDVDKKDVVYDDLVTFKGDVVGNTIVNGTAKLTYTPAEGTPTDGAFKGSFYGSKAEEMGGSVNSIKSGYANAHWGAVFGAQRATASSGNANQID